MYLIPLYHIRETMLTFKSAFSISFVILFELGLCLVPTFNLSHIEAQTVQDPETPDPDDPFNEDSDSDENFGSCEDEDAIAIFQAHLSSLDEKLDEICELSISDAKKFASKIRYALKADLKLLKALSSLYKDEVMDNAVWNELKSSISEIADNAKNIKDYCSDNSDEDNDPFDDEDEF